MVMALHMAGGRPRRSVNPEWLKTVLLMHCDGVNGATTFIDSSQYAHTFSRDQAKLGTSVKMFGTAALDLTPGILNVNNATAAEFTFGTSDFTFELWFRLPISNSVNTLIDFRSSTSGKQPMVQIGSDSIISLWNNNGVEHRFSTGVIFINQWHHLAVSRAAGVTRGFYNGLMGTQFADTIDYPFAGASKPMIGALTNTQLNMSGYLDEIRVMIGLGKYTANFAPPTKPFPDKDG